MKILRKRKPYVAVGSHIYAGGFALGIQRAGFDISMILETGDFGVETCKANIEVPVHVGVDNWPEEFGHVDLLFTNPPCASWSQAGVKTKDKEVRNTNRWSHDNRTDCTIGCFRLATQMQPKVFIWESVLAATKNGRPFIEDRIQEMRAAGYKSYIITFNGLDCGLPQVRRRMFFIASKVKIVLRDPPFKGVSTVTRTVGSLLSVVPKTASKETSKTSPQYAKILKTMKPGEVSLHKAFHKMLEAEGKEMERGSRGQVLGRPGFLNQRLLMNKPAPTITGGPQFFHPTEPRCMTIVEQQMLCGYPADYQFYGNTNSKYAQIAKAVLPPPAEWIGRIVRASLDENQRISSTELEEVSYL